MGEKHSLIFKVFSLLILAGGTLGGCTEPFSPEIPASEGILVVEASLTNELKNHQIFLSRSTQAEDSPKEESNAVLRIVDNNDQTYSFTETSPGTYASDIAFSAEPNTSYQLFITTTDGQSYSSGTVELPSSSQIDRVYSERATTDSGLDGVEIFVDSFDPTSGSRYYKYEYEETYKIVAPNWGPDQLVVASEENRTVAIVSRTEEERTCFASDTSNSIILTNTSGATEDRVSRLAVRFLNQDNYIISPRYSILVKQFVLSRDAFTFYEKLRDFSGSESLFSQSQPGFINGNIVPENGDQRVIGIFEISSVSEKRAFFNYADLFPNEELPSFVSDCIRTNFLADGTSSIFDLVKANTVSYVNNISDPFTGQVLEYIVVPRVCGDCNELGSATVPDFWEE